jgi:activator of 2-hydroxyglutaryl-CoA dehydratase
MQKVPLNEILAGVCESIVTRVLENVQRAGGGEPDIAFTGGVANNLGIRHILEEKLGMKLFVPVNPQSTGALGAAHLARLNYRSVESGKVKRNSPSNQSVM